MLEFHSQGHKKQDTEISVECGRFITFHSVLQRTRGENALSEKHVVGPRPFNLTRSSQGEPCIATETSEKASITGITGHKRVQVAMYRLLSASVRPACLRDAQATSKCTATSRLDLGRTRAFAR